MNRLSTVMLSVCLSSAACTALLSSSASAAPATPATKRAAHTSAKLPPAGPEQLDAVRYALLGHYRCAGGQALSLQADNKNPGYLKLNLKQKTWTMKPLMSPTGAVRIEDIHGETLFLQIAYKSMLLNVKTGRRILDACVHPAQRAAEQAARNQSKKPGRKH